MRTNPSEDSFPQYVLRIGDQRPKKVSPEEFQQASQRLGIIGSSFSGFDNSHRVGATGQMIYGTIAETAKELKAA